MAVVHDPKNTDDTYKLQIGNFIIQMVKNADDFDFKSLYPSETLQHNIAPNTQIGMIQINNQVHPRENVFKNERFSRGGVFLEDYQSGNVIEFCKRWLHFAGYMEMMDDLIEYYTYIAQLQSTNFYVFGNKVRPMIVTQVNNTPRDMIHLISPENNVPRNAIALLYDPLDKNMYNHYFEEKRFIK